MLNLLAPCFLCSVLFQTALDCVIDYLVIQTNPVNRIATFPSFSMRLTGICNYPYQTNICKFTALLDFCPHPCYL